MSGTPCFLEEDEWQDVFASLAVDPEPFAEKGKLNMTAAAGLVTTPGLSVRIGGILQNGGNPDAPWIIETAKQVRHELARARIWQINFDQELSLMPEESRTPEREAQILALHCSGLIWHMLLSWMLSAIVPSDREQLIHEAQDQAMQVVQIERDVDRNDQRQVMMLAPRSSVAYTVLMAIPLWSEVAHSGELLEHWRFQQFSQAMRELIHCNKVPQKRIGGVWLDVTGHNISFNEATRFLALD